MSGSFKAVRKLIISCYTEWSGYSFCIEKTGKLTDWEGQQHERKQTAFMSK